MPTNNSFIFLGNMRAARHAGGWPYGSTKTTCGIFLSPRWLQSYVAPGLVYTHMALSYNLKGFTARMYLPAGPVHVLEWGIIVCCGYVAFDGRKNMYFKADHVSQCIE